MKPVLEKEIETNIYNFLQECGFSVDKINNVGIYDANKKTYRKPGANFRPGIADLIGTLPDGRFFTIEVKSKTGKPSRAQLDWIAEKHKNKGIAFIARSVQQVNDSLHCFYDMSKFHYILKKYQFIENCQNQ